ncbi:acyl-CoA synthetase [Salinisphaera sp. SWV1]|uniref:acyl-CoA synthetase n=1 Tax=Salinisphaera sp. SWV1 TaxID=3454139 RepID=UPI003F8509DA
MVRPIVPRPRSDAVTHPFNIDLDRNPANFQPLTPLTFLERAASVMPDRLAIIHGDLRYTYGEFYSRARQLGSALSGKGVARGDAVSVLLPNVPAMLEAHHGVPMCGAVLHAINTRLDAKTLAFQLDHAGSRALIVDGELLPLARSALDLTVTVKPTLIVYADPEAPGATENTSNALDYESFLATGDAHYEWLMPEDEWDAISISYTSGTTGDPKGVVYHHRGAYLLAQGNALISNMPRYPVYLWTLPMFHCNGWCFPWTMSVVFGTHVCLRQVRAEPIWRAIAEHGVTHMCGAPAVMSLLVASAPGRARPGGQTVEFFTAAAPPPEKVLAEMESAGFNVTQLYGLTETYGPAVVNEWKPDWDALDPTARAARKARQGVRYPPLEGLEVMDPETMEIVPRDGQTVGEVMFRGNAVMKGYFRNPEANRKAFSGGWFHSGDLGVVHPDGYIQLKDRSKDIIISGGENISSIEIEEALYKHPAVAVAAVVAMHHDKWGETPCAFIEFAAGQTATSEELEQHCRNTLASYKIPRRFIFEEVPRTATGKIQKYELRKRLTGDPET